MLSSLVDTRDPRALQSQQNFSAAQEARDRKMKVQGLYSVTPVLATMGGRRVSEKQRAHRLNPCR